MQNAIPLTKQLEYYKDYQTKLTIISSNASGIISESLYLLSAGSSDFVQNYYIDPLLYKHYTPDQFSDILILSFSKFIQVIAN